MFFDLKGKESRIPIHDRRIPEKRDIEPEREIGPEGNFGIAVAGSGKDDDSDDAPGEVGEEESERRDFRSCYESHEEGDAEITSAHPFPSRDENLDIEEGEYPECAEQGVDEGDTEDRVVEREEVSEYRDIDPERYDEEEEEEREICGDEDLIGDFHEEYIVENEHYRHKGDGEEKSEFHHLCRGTREEKYGIHEEIPGEQEENTGRELEERVYGGDPFLTEPAFPPEEDIGKDRKEIEGPKGVSAFRAMAPTGRDSSLAAPDAPDEHRCETSEQGSEDEEGSEEENSHLR